jgi:hypothetical protein
MLYADIKRCVLSLINQYTMAGTSVRDSYNNQADYLKRIPQFINAALMNIRTTTKPITVSYRLTDGTIHGDAVWYELPKDCWKIVSGGVYRLENGKIWRSNDCAIVGDRVVGVPLEKKGEFWVDYCRFPEQLPLDAADTFELNEEPDVLQAAEFYAAALLILPDDAFVYASLFNEYETRLARMTRAPGVDINTVQDVYGLGYNGGYEV